MWRSVISWMLWFLTTPTRLLAARQARQEAREQERREQLSSLLRAELLEALTSLAHALERQDRLAEHLTQRVQQDLETAASQQTELLVEVLSSLQPTAESQILPMVQASTPPQSSRSWES
jgi:hypothetical protein